MKKEIKPDKASNQKIYDVIIPNTITYYAFVYRWKIDEEQAVWSDWSQLGFMSQDYNVVQHSSRYCNVPGWNYEMKIISFELPNYNC